MGASLERLTSNLPDNAMKLLENQFASKRDNINLIYKIGYYPYLYMNGPEKFNKTKLPDLALWKKPSRDKKFR